MVVPPLASHGRAACACAYGNCFNICAYRYLETSQQGDSSGKVCCEWYRPAEFDDFCLFVVLFTVIVLLLMQRSMVSLSVVCSGIQSVDDKVFEMVKRWLQTTCPEQFTLNTLYKDAKLIGQIQSECSGWGQNVDALLSRSLMKLLKEDILTVANTPDGDAAFQVLGADCFEGGSKGRARSCVETLQRLCLSMCESVLVLWLVAWPICSLTICSCSFVSI